MIDLEHLDTLDDDAPPDPSLSQVHRRARRIRTRNGFAAAGIGVGVIAIVLIAVAAYSRDTTDVAVLVPPTTPVEKRTASGPLPNGLRIELTLETPTVVPGSDIRATVVVRNETGDDKVLGIDPIQCALDVGPVLYDADRREVVNEAGHGCYAPGVILAPGASRSFDVRLPTTNVTAEGRYFLSLQEATGNPPWALAKVPVIITATDLRARLELPETSYPAGYSLEGTIVFFNGTKRPVEYRVGCPPQWEVDLSKDGVPFVPALPEICGPALSSETLEPGENRVQFYVTLTYPMCVNEAPGPAAPLCVGDPPGIPDLPPGTYQLVFRGAVAPFDSIEVDPVTISVG